MRPLLSPGRLGFRGIGGVAVAVDFANALDLPGASGDYASTPDAVANDVTSDLDVRVRVALDDWTPATSQTLMAKYNISAQRSWLFFLNTVGRLSVVLSTDGTATLTLTANGEPAVSDGGTKWVRFALDTDNGSGSKEISFYQSDNGVDWAQIGTTITDAGTIVLHNSSGKLTAGSFDIDGGGTGLQSAGVLYRAQLLNGINGTVVADFDPTLAVVGEATFVAATGETWTKLGNASFIN